MKNVMKNEILNDVLTGLLVAATFAAVVPMGALAQDLASVAGNSQTGVFGPAVTIISYIAYGLGTVMVVAGIAGCKKHADNASSNPLAPALGKLGAGAAFLAAPSVMHILQTTGSSVTGGGSSSWQGVTF